MCKNYKAKKQCSNKYYACEHGRGQNKMKFLRIFLFRVMNFGFFYSSKILSILSNSYSVSSSPLTLSKVCLDLTLEYMTAPIVTRITAKRASTMTTKQTIRHIVTSLVFWLIFVDSSGVKVTVTVWNSNCDVVVDTVADTVWIGLGDEVGVIEIDELGATWEIVHPGTLLSQ